MTTVRKSLHPLQPAAGDKENLVGPGRMIHADKDNLKSFRETNGNDNVSTSPDSKSNKRKKVISKSTQVGDSKPVIKVEDLTSSEPSENYWQRLAEKRRAALEETLGENERLHDENERLREKIERLQEENRMCKELLKEQESLVETLNEMLNETADDSVNINDSLDG